MRIASYHSNSDIRIEECPAPQVGPGESLVKIHASGICGSDIMEWYRRDKVPLVLGHEIAGEIAAIGPGVSNIQVGDRVVASHHVPALNAGTATEGMKPSARHYIPLHLIREVFPSMCVCRR